MSGNFCQRNIGDVNHDVFTRPTSQTTCGDFDLDKRDIQINSIESPRLILRLCFSMIQNRVLATEAANWLPMIEFTIGNGCENGQCDVVNIEYILVVA